jgi:hypothetical protein
MFQHDSVTKASNAFEARWTMLALKRVDNELYEALQEQQGLYYEATVQGSEDDIKAHAEALVRGYAAAVVTMEQAEHPDDAYLVGRHNGMVVVISEHKAVQNKLVELASTGERAVLMSPDEVALLMGSMQGLSMISAIKQLFPGAELIAPRIDRYPDEPAKGDE